MPTNDDLKNINDCLAGRASFDAVATVSISTDLLDTSSQSMVSRW